MINKKDIPKELYDKVLKNQKEKGMTKYGHSLDECPKERFNWFIMAIEELIDLEQYIAKLKQCQDGIEISRQEKNGATLLLNGKKVHRFKTVYAAEKFIQAFLR